ncbi:GTP-binding protein [Macrococcus capreoli]
MEDINSLHLRKDTENKIKNLYEYREKSELTIGIFGSFSVGKSTLINALLNQELLPSHAKETTAVSTLIKVSDKQEMKLVFDDLHEENISHEEFLNLKAGNDVENIYSAEITVNEPKWMEDINFIDTPGRNTKYSRHIDASERAISESDVAFYVTSWKGLDLEDIVYIKHIMRYQPNIYFIVNKVDSIDESQGLTINDLKEHVQKDIVQMLGEEYPVVMVSAKTKFNVEHLMDIIVELKSKINLIKDEKLKFAIRELLVQEKQFLNNELSIINNAFKEDYKVENEKNKLNIQYEKSKAELDNYLVKMEEKINFSKEKMSSQITILYEELENSLIKISQKESSIEKIQTEIENEIITVRNKVTDLMKNELLSLFDSENHINLSNIDNANGVKLEVTNIDFEDLEESYRQRKELLSNKKMKLINELDALESKDPSLYQQEKERITESINKLEEELKVEFIPRYKEDVNFDPNKNEKMFEKVGMVADLVLTTVVTARATNTPKGAAISATKEVGKEVAKTTIKTQAKNTLAKTMSTLKVVDTLNSPVQTVAKSIGQVLDSFESPQLIEDVNYRNQFYTQKYNIEQKKNEELNKLKQLEKETENDEILKRKIKERILKVTQSAEKELRELEIANEKIKKLRIKEHQTNQIREQIEKILVDEKININIWFNDEVEKSYFIMQKVMPESLIEEVQKWQNEINRIEELKSENHNKLVQNVEEINGKLIKLNKLIERY